jgi:hypothetical protein
LVAITTLLQDSFAIAIAHQEEGVSVLDVVREWKPKFDPSTVVSEAAAIFKQYGVINISGDNYGGEWPVEAFRNCGVSYQRSTKHRSELYLEFIPKVNGKQVELLDNRELIEELRRLERRRGHTGKDSIEHRAGAHDDIANAVAGVMSLLGAKSQSSNVFNPSLHISRQPLRFAPSGWPLIVGVSADETFAASVIAQTYMSEVRVFAAWCSEGISLRHHLQEFPKAWLSANSPRLQLFGGYENDPNPEIRGKLHDAATEVLNGQWCSVWDKYDSRLDKMRDALQKAVPFKFTPAVTFSPVDTAALTQALSSGRYRDKVAADKRSYHCVNALSLLLCRLEFGKTGLKKVSRGRSRRAGWRCDSAECVECVDPTIKAGQVRAAQVYHQRPILAFQRRSMCHM